MTQLAAPILELLGRLGARLLQHLNAPLQFFLLQTQLLVLLLLQFALLLVLRGPLPNHIDGLGLGLLDNHDQQDNQYTHGADQHGQEREQADAVVSPGRSAASHAARS